jgi:hypothetical protein
MLEGAEIGLAFPVEVFGPVGAEPQVLRAESFWFWPLLVGVLVPALAPVFAPEFDPVEAPVLEPVLAPVGFEAVGTTAGTEVQALSYAARLVLD